MKAKRVIPASSSRFAAQLFNIITVVALLISLTALLLGKLLASQKIGFLPFVLSLPPVMRRRPCTARISTPTGAALHAAVDQDRRLPRGLRLLPAIGALRHRRREAEKLMLDRRVLAAARAAKEAGATRFCMGAAWRGPKERDLEPVPRWCARSRRWAWRPAPRWAC
jgi:hypothetical protein